jgi:hypothetical protein
MKKDLYVSYSLSHPNANITYKWYLLFSKTRLWRPSHGGIYHSSIHLSLYEYVIDSTDGDTARRTLHNRAVTTRLRHQWNKRDTDYCPSCYITSALAGFMYQYLILLMWDSFSLCVQCSSKAHPASNPLATGVQRAARVWRWPLTHI